MAPIVDHANANPAKSSGAATGESRRCQTERYYYGTSKDPQASESSVGRHQGDRLGEGERKNEATTDSKHAREDQHEERQNQE